MRRRPTLRSGKGETKGELLGRVGLADNGRKDKEACETESAEGLGKTRARAGQVRPVPDVDSSTEGGKRQAHPSPRMLPAEKRERWCDMQGEDGGLILWNDHYYPKALDNDGTVLHDTPEAHPATADLLPHLHSNLDSLFPCAQACPPAGDADPPEDTSLGTRGWWTGLGVEAPLEAREASGDPCKTTPVPAMVVEAECDDVEEESGLPELVPLPQVNIWYALKKLPKSRVEPRHDSRRSRYRWQARRK